MTIARDGVDYVVRYEPGESSTGLFGGNSNWRGPIWFPINFLLIETLQKFHHYYGDDFLVECPTGSGQKLTLWQIADRALVPAHAHLSAWRGWTSPCLRHERDLPDTTRIGATTRCSTSTSMAIQAEASVPATRQGGLDWWPSCLSRPRAGRPLSVEHS